MKVGAKSTSHFTRDYIEKYKFSSGKIMSMNSITKSKKEQVYKMMLDNKIEWK